MSGAWYVTNYRGNWAPIGKDEDLARPGTYGSYIFASSRRQATRIALYRGLGEKVLFERGGKGDPYPRASEVLAATRGHNRGMYPKLHSLSFLGMIALSSGAATIQEILGDTGIIHEMCHARCVEKDLIERVRIIEERVPGYCRGGAGARIKNA